MLAYQHNTCDFDNYHTENKVIMKRIVALGGGESGVGDAVLAKVKGLDIFLSDNSSISPEAKATLDKYGIAYEGRGHSREENVNAA